jgi:hypothetical protein
LGGAARNWTLVSSDREVQAAGRTARARIISSEDFAATLLEGPGNLRGSAETRPEGLAPDELDEWMDLFGVDEISPERGQDDDPT